jgi:hypothetical protein
MACTALRLGVAGKAGQGKKNFGYFMAAAGSFQCFRQPNVGAELQGAEHPSDQVMAALGLDG